MEEVNSMKGFNSKLVRLKAVAAFAAGIVKLGSFNSKLVRLKAHES